MAHHFRGSAACHSESAGGGRRIWGGDSARTRWENLSEAGRPHPRPLRASAFAPLRATGRPSFVGGLFAAIVVLLAYASSTQTAAAQTLEVGGDGYPTISAAVQAASPGDTVLIHAGTYREEVAIDKRITLDVSGDGDVWVDGQCLRNHGFWIWGDGATLRNIKVKNTIEAAVFLNADRPDQQLPSNVTIDGMTLQDFDCTWTSQEPSTWGQYRAGIAAWYTGSGIHITNNLIQHRAISHPTFGQWGSADGIWFKSSDNIPSGGGHYIAGNTIIGGWDGIAGEEEGSAHGTFDRDTIVENNTIRDCWDDGIQSEGGDQDVRIRHNDISGCGTGIAFAPPVTGPLYIENNRIHDLSIGLYENLFCFKVGNGGGGTAYLTGNVCDVDGSAEASQGGADGIHQTNEGLSPIVSRRNIFQVSAYVFILPEFPQPPGTSFDEDCISTTDPERFVKWSGSVYYSSLAQLQTATGAEPNGRQTTDCSFLGTPTPLPALTPPPRTTPGARQTPSSQLTPAPAAQTPSSQPTPTADSGDGFDLTSPMALGLEAMAGLTLLGVGFVGGAIWSRRRRATP